MMQQPPMQFEGEDPGKLRDQFQNYVQAKGDEIDEARLAWSYYHGKHWTSEQLKILADRRQPAVTFNRISRKVDGLVGTIGKMRNDPKAFPRTPAHEQGAEIATIALRYVFDTNKWEQQELEAIRTAAVHHTAVMEFGLTQGDAGDPDLSMTLVDSTTFFYDPRALKHDYSDARYLGTSKWADRDDIEEAFPGFSEDYKTHSEYGDVTQFDHDKEHLWVDNKGRLRLVDHWYKKKGQWFYCIHAGGVKVEEGPSPFIDEKGRSLCKYVAFSAFVDADGTRYGMVRNMKGPQDAINQHRSKAVWIMNARQIIADPGVFSDIEKVRKEAMRPDGVILKDAPGEVQVTQPEQEFLQQTKYFEDAKLEIENFGPNPSIMGTGVNARSGRALAMMQQSGIAELGPFLTHYTAWKLNLYRFAWNALKTFWRSERWMRVTDDEGMAQFIGVNRIAIDEYGMPAMINGLGQLDVDIILDEGPDTTNVMGDVFDVLSSLAQSKFPVPPEVILEAANLPKSQKDKMIKQLTEARQAPDQAAAQAAQAEQQRQMAEQQKMAFAAQLENQKLQANSEIEDKKLAAKVKADEESARIERERDQARADIEWQKALDAYNLRLMTLQAESQSRREEALLQDDVHRAKIASDGRAKRSESGEYDMPEAEDEGPDEKAMFREALVELANAARVTKVATKVADGKWKVEAVG